MRKILVLLILAFILSGCATYKFKKSTSGSQGYLACYDGYPLPEYTLGKGKSLPDLTLAKERFKRRRSTVEYYYKKMDQIESRIKAFLWEPPAMVVGFLGGVVRWPFIAVADYKYNHNPKYKAGVDRRDEEKEALETARLGSLRKELDAYIAEDLSKESLPPGAVEAAVPAPKSLPEVLPVTPESPRPAPAVPVLDESIPKTEKSLVNPETAVEPSTAAPATIEKSEVEPLAAPTPAAQPEVLPVTPEPAQPAPEALTAIQEVVPKTEISPVNPETTAEPPAAPAAIKEEPVVEPVAKPAPVVQPPVAVAVEETPVAKRVLEPPVAVIIAQPVKGYSPLKVNFSAKKSSSKSGKIVSYLWDFGDGDTSTKKNTENTYWSTTFGLRTFTATLTVSDNAGNTSVASTAIEVITK